MSMQTWLRHEWQRSGLALRLANAACEVLNAATRKYLTADHLWYYPPPDAFVKLADYANTHGKPEGRPYFSIDGKRPPVAARCGDGRVHAGGIPRYAVRDPPRCPSCALHWRHQN